MTDSKATDHRVEQLMAMVIDSVHLADELKLSEVAVRLEQARLLLVNRPD